LRHSTGSDKLNASTDSMGEVPSFLRKQSDSAEAVHVPKVPERTVEFWTTEHLKRREGIGLARWTAYEGLTPAGFVEWLRLNPDFTPDSYASLRATGLPAAVVEWLEFVVGAGQLEAEVVAAFVQAMTELRFKRGVSVLTSLGLVKTDQEKEESLLSARIEAGLAGIRSIQWPVAIFDFS
jgi:hypothetical protein